MSKYRLLLFDRDGTLTYENANYHRDLETVRGYPFTATVLQRLQKSGYQLAAVTNQSGIGRGYWSADDVLALHNRLATEWAVDLKWYVCPHHPDDDCSCRKPSGEMIHDALLDFNTSAGETLMIGDSPPDGAAAAAAGVDFVLVLTGRGRETLRSLPEPQNMIANLGELESILD